MKKILLCLAAGFLLAGCADAKQEEFACVRDGQFFIDGKPYYFIGANFWYGPILGSQGCGGDRERLIRELDTLHAMGVDNLRILVGSDGVEGVVSKVEPTLQTSPSTYNDEILDGLDFMMSEMGKRGMKAVLYLNNSWEWSGGYTQYVMWAEGGRAPIPRIDGGDAYMEYAGRFIRSQKAKELFLKYTEDIVTRTNRYTGTKYTDDPTLFSWQICNEPRAFAEENKELFAEWISSVARRIRELDKNHMISTGSEGKYGCETDIDLWERIHAIPEISYFTIHVWAYNWRWADPADLLGSVGCAAGKATEYITEHAQIARTGAKPIVVEEFGYPRDAMKFAKGTPTEARDIYYSKIFDIIKRSAAVNGIISGCNFWGWGGFASPSSAHTFWEAGDDYCGDPAQEEQGLNSVFCGDSTVVIIRNYAKDLYYENNK